MTRQEKDLIKMTIKRLNWSVYGFVIMGVIGMFTGMGLMLLSIKTQTTTGMEVGFFAFGAFLLIVAQLLSTRVLKMDKKLGDYRREIQDKRDWHYYNMVCVYSKRGDLVKADSFCKLIKDEKRQATMVGFMLSDTMERNNRHMMNTVLGKTIDNMKKYGM